MGADGTGVRSYRWNYKHAIKFLSQICDAFVGKSTELKAIYDPVNNIYDLKTITGDEDENRELLYFCWDEVMLIPIAGKLETMIKERRKNV